MNHSTYHFFERFLFDPLEGLKDVEQLFQDLSRAYAWVHSAQNIDPKPGWLQRGLFTPECVPWVEDFFHSVVELFVHKEQDEFRDILGKLSELLAALPHEVPKAHIFGFLLQQSETLHDEMDRAWILNTLVEHVSEQGDRPWTPAFFQEAIRHARSFASEYERVHVLGRLAFALGVLGASSWVPRTFESILSMLRSFRTEEHTQEAVSIVFEQFLGHERLRPELAHVSSLKHLVIQLLAIGVTNSKEFRATFSRRVLFAQRMIRGAYTIVPDAWKELLDACQTLDAWTHTELDLQDEVRWTIMPLSVLLGWIGFDFSKAHNRGWVQRFFHTLCEALFQLPAGNEREEAIRSVVQGLVESFQGNERETIAWIKFILEHAERVESNTSRIYEGLFLGFLEHGDLHRAATAAVQISLSALRDQAHRRLVQAWVEKEQPQQALDALYEINDAAIRGEVLLFLSSTPTVLRDPMSCAMLFRAAASLPTWTQDVLRNVVSHPAFPKEAQEAILATAPFQPLGLSARNERLAELERLKSYIPEEVYIQERRNLFGLTDWKSSLPSPEELVSPMPNASNKVVIDRPHRYGDGLYLTPEEHIQTNHFGRDVAGSRFTAWTDFSQMWKEIHQTVEERIQEDEGVQVIELELPMDVGITGVMSLSEAPADHLATEIRNGQPSLFCVAPEVRQPTRTITVVVGPSQIEAYELEGYKGHTLPLVLYTMYPGKPAYPFPRCEKEDYVKLEMSLQAALSLLQSGQFEEARSVLYETYSHMEGSDEAARYWSRNVLIH